MLAGGFPSARFHQISENPCIFAAHIFDNENLCGYLFFDTFTAGHIRPFCFFTQEKMAVEAVELVANVGGDPVCAGVLGDEYYVAFFVQNLLLYFSMYRLAEACLCFCIVVFQDIVSFLEENQNS